MRTKIFSFILILVCVTFSRGAGVVSRGGMTPGVQAPRVSTLVAPAPTTVDVQQLLTLLQNNYESAVMLSALFPAEFFPEAHVYFIGRADAYRNAINLVKYVAGI